jgi:hypothetical protein
MVVDRRGARRGRMRIQRAPSVAALAAALSVPGAIAAVAQDKYALQVPEGLAFSEFRGYETWQVVSASHPIGEGGMTDGGTINIIVGNPAVIEAYASGIPGNGKPFPDGAKLAKIQYVPMKSTEAPFDVTIPDRLKDVAFMLKDSARFEDSGGWGYALFDYTPRPTRSRPTGRARSAAPRATRS